MYIGWCEIGEDLGYFPFKSYDESECLYIISNRHSGEYCLYVYQDIFSNSYEHEIFLHKYFECISSPTLGELVMFEIEFGVPIKIVEEGLNKLKGLYEI